MTSSMYLFRGGLWGDAAPSSPPSRLLQLVYIYFSDVAGEKKLSRSMNIQQF